jgi:hypothetical protein
LTRVDVGAITIVRSSVTTWLGGALPNIMPATVLPNTAALISSAKSKATILVLVEVGFMVRSFGFRI